MYDLNQIPLDIESNVNQIPPPKKMIKKIVKSIKHNLNYIPTTFLLEHRYYLTRNQKRVRPPKNAKEKSHVFFHFQQRKPMPAKRVVERSQSLLVARKQNKTKQSHLAARRENRTAVLPRPKNRKLPLRHPKNQSRF